MEGLDSSKVTQRQDGIENSGRILLCHSVLPFLQMTEPLSMTGQENKGTDQAAAGRTDAEGFCFSRASVGSGHMNELFTKESAGGG